MGACVPSSLSVGATPTLTCLPVSTVAELCLLLSRKSGCRMPAWTWLTSLPPMVSYTSSARYGGGECAQGTAQAG